MDKRPVLVKAQDVKTNVVDLRLAARLAVLASLVSLPVVHEYRRAYFWVEIRKENCSYMLKRISVDCYD